MAAQNLSSSTPKDNAQRALELSRKTSLSKTGDAVKNRVGDAASGAAAEVLVNGAAAAVGQAARDTTTVASEIAKGAAQGATVAGVGAVAGAAKGAAVGLAKTETAKKTLALVITAIVLVLALLAAVLASTVFQAALFNPRQMEIQGTAERAALNAHEDIMEVAGPGVGGDIPTNVAQYQQTARDAGANHLVLQAIALANEELRQGGTLGSGGGTSGSDGPSGGGVGTVPPGELTCAPVPHIPNWSAGSGSTKGWKYYHPAPIEDGLNDNAAHGVRCADEMWGAKVSGYHGARHVNDSDIGDASDHVRGDALDLSFVGTGSSMDYRTAEGRAFGDEVAEWFVTHAAEMNVDYIIWWEKVWRANTGTWGPYGGEVYANGAGSDTAAHRDHVHVSFHAGDSTGPVGSNQGSGTAINASTHGYEGEMLLRKDINAPGSQLGIVANRLAQAEASSFSGSSLPQNIDAGYGFLNPNDASRSETETGEDIRKRVRERWVKAIESVPTAASEQAPEYVFDLALSWSLGEARTEVCKPEPTTVPAGGTGSGGLEIPSEYKPYLEAAAVESGFPVELLAAQLQQESSWNPQAKSAAGAQGLAQFMPATWAAYGNGGDPFNPQHAIAAQGRYMRALADTVRHLASSDEEVVVLTLAAYNAGPGAVLQYGGVPPFEETEHYVVVIPKMAGNVSLVTGSCGIRSDLVNVPDLDGITCDARPDIQDYGTGRSVESGLDGAALPGFRCGVGAFHPDHGGNFASWHGLRSGSGSSDHHWGGALDISSSHLGVGQPPAEAVAVAEFYLAHAQELNVNYVIFFERMASASEAGKPFSEWGPYHHAGFGTTWWPGGGDHSAAHRDHVHVSFNRR
ncbi:lytic transglycosylase domain-containing protein [Nesterenkonia rhizosphaerae]|uniref:Transglycosylase SLT domain-containing protein n=1 Tax=Nesterenkonia rhizosphaerae TaxID=1348272 RepID=A0ABP9G0K5_9MICC